MSTKTKILTTLALLPTLVITLGACTAKVQLPVLGEAPDFALINQDNLEVRLSDFRGKVVVMNFIYTTCPDACGRLNSKLKTVWDRLEEGQKQDLVIISVSFDPEVDTPEVLKRYASDRGFDLPKWQFLTGTQTQIRQVTDNYGAWYELVEDIHTDEAPHNHVLRFAPNLVVVLIAQAGRVRRKYENAFFPESGWMTNIQSLLRLGI